MFTGIVTERGTAKKVRERSGILELEVEARDIARELKTGDSVAVNGVCLTATSVSRKTFSTQAMEETTSLTTLGQISKGDRVNLELPVRLEDRLGGHLVQGHVDGIAKVVRIEDDDAARRVWLSTDGDLLRYLVRKGSVALDGVSLTIAEVGRSTFQVALIPHTLDATTLGILGVGSRVNLEVDIIAKYIERFTKDHSDDPLV